MQCSVIESAMIAFSFSFIPQITEARSDIAKERLEREATACAMADERLGGQP